MDDAGGTSTPRDTTTPPPFTCSTTRNSLAWLASGAPVDFTQEVNEQTSSDPQIRASIADTPPASNDSSASSQRDFTIARESVELEQNIPKSPRKLRKQPPPRVARKPVHYPSNVTPKKKTESRPTTVVEPVIITDTEHPRTAAASFHPILSNEIITKSNPRGPRKRSWAWRDLVRKHWWW